MGRTYKEKKGRLAIHRMGWVCKGYMGGVAGSFATQILRTRTFALGQKPGLLMKTNLIARTCAWPVWNRPSLGHAFLSQYNLCRRSNVKSRSYR